MAAFLPSSPTGTTSFAHFFYFFFFLFAAAAPSFFFFSKYQKVGLRGIMLAAVRSGDAEKLGPS